jgi:hypothetical protein
MRTPRTITALLLALSGLAFAAPAPALSQDQPTEPTPRDPAPAEPAATDTTQPQTEPAPEPTLVVRDLFVIQADKYGERANDPVQVRSTLNTPMPHQGRAKLKLDSGVYADTPMPLGLISFQGEIREPMTVSVEALGDRALLHAHWPKDAIRTETTRRWLRVQQANDQQRPQPIGGGGHWLEALREADDRLWIASRDPLRKERFMLYDASFVFEPALAVAMKDEGYLAKSSQPADHAPPLTMLVHQQDGGWSASTVAGAWDKQQAGLGKRPEHAGAYSPDLKAVFEPLAELLAERGYAATEIDMAVRMVRGAGLDKSSMSLVYVMPAGAIDEHVRLAFKPKPDKVIRTAIVVLTNADPDLGSRINRLIADLGSDRWIERARAQQALQAMGQAAIKQLQEQRNSDDPEIAFRARQLLDTYDLKIEQDR